ncbi:hypothetical protein [Actinomadura sp. 6N118]|uniref:hypothetical protein n=1 Tax=Actinomadura sp. 6N118 TaxID=3375151 RepID=UPI00379B2689
MGDFGDDYMMRVASEVTDNALAGLLEDIGERVKTMAGIVRRQGSEYLSDALAGETLRLQNVIRDLRNDERKPTS